MSPLSLRPSLRRYAAHLNRRQRRAWMIARLQRSPRVAISSGWLPRTVARTYAYVSVGGK
ncbi:hypothetical protein NQH47_00190 [Burkholderia pseudomallei]|uniref:hypothetical protein n=1 Tax=Burkholderia pseudomallei TaxID=28450 RepID=UPI0005721C08|nr:hypothetical protein [Burkholderia pseudomallei]MCE2035841.1 hypothetical protein [Burkholderia pseudomallei CS]MCE2041849.1 hypothetical protein [Burkholderia pseudomallei CB]MCQ8219716.1 hypothetical protein [Burkholderia pseudomallei]MDV2160751.1 hypothetical protein [Burkholderia pseudomallei]MDV2234239.1 hypothetical protein [Burkholderia pseudomallei]